MLCLKYPCAYEIAVFIYWKNPSLLRSCICNNSCTHWKTIEHTVFHCFYQTDDTTRCFAVHMVSFIHFNQITPHLFKHHPISLFLSTKVLLHSYVMYLTEPQQCTFLVHQLCHKPGQEIIHIEGQVEWKPKNFFTACMLQMDLVYSFIISQHSPRCIQCMSCNASLTPGFLLKRNSVGPCA